MAQLEVISYCRNRSFVWDKMSHVSFCHHVWSSNYYVPISSDCHIMVKFRDSSKRVHTAERLHAAAEPEPNQDALSTAIEANEVNIRVIF